MQFRMRLVVVDGPRNTKRFTAQVQKRSTKITEWGNWHDFHQPRDNRGQAESDFLEARFYYGESMGWEQLPYSGEENLWLKSIPK